MQAIAQVFPRDEYNETLISKVHPPDWQNPDPASRYSLVVIGAGTAGLENPGCDHCRSSCR